jgi:hypothetical protein
MQVATAFVKFLGDFTEVNKGFDYLPQYGGQAGVNVGANFASKMGVAVKVGLAGIASTGIAGILQGLGKDLEESEARLKGAIESVGGNFETLKPKIEGAQDAMTKFGYKSNEVDDALAILTLAYKDPIKAMEMLSVTTKIATAKNEDLKTAAGDVANAHNGMFKGLQKIIPGLRDSAAAVHALTIAEKLHQTAVDALAKPTQHLNDLMAEDAKIKHLSLPQQFALRDAHKAVADAQAKVTTTTQNLATATTAAAGATKNGDKAMTDWAAHYNGDLDKAKTTSGVWDSIKAKVENFGASVGAQAAGPLTAMGVVTTAFSPLLQAGVGGWIKEHAKFGKAVEKDVGVVAAAGEDLVGKEQASFAKRAALAVAHGVKMAALFVADHVRQLAASAGELAIWTASAAKRLVMESATLVKETALYVASGAKKAAIEAGEFALSAGRWIAHTALQLAQAGIRLAIWIGSHAIMLATSIATAIGVAAAFLLPLLPFILIGLAIGLLVLLVVTHFSQIRDFVVGVVSKIIAVFLEFAPKVGKAILDVLLFFPKLEFEALQFFGGLVGKIIGFFLTIPGRMAQIGGDILHAFAKGIADAAGHLPVIGASIQHLLGFSEGGVVPGMTGAAQLAVVHGGERIQTPAQQKEQGKGGFNVGEINVYNPTPEPASTSTGRELRKLAYLGQAS